jgi:dephospho-CoA kinase
MIVIGLTGKRGCGKDTVAKYLAEKHNFMMLDFTKDVLSPILEKQGKPVTRDNLIKIAMEGRKKSHNGIWAERLSTLIKKKSRKNFVISGIRFREEVGVFRKNFKNDFRLVAVVCDEKNRYEWVKKRGTKGEANITFKNFMEMEKRETERVIGETMKIADYAIDNNGTLEELHEEIENLMKILNK